MQRPSIRPKRAHTARNNQARSRRGVRGPMLGLEPVLWFLAATLLWWVPSACSRANVGHVGGGEGVGKGLRDSACLALEAVIADVAGPEGMTMCHDGRSAIGSIILARSPLAYFSETPSEWELRNLLDETVGAELGEGALGLLMESAPVDLELSELRTPESVTLKEYPRLAITGWSGDYPALAGADMLLALSLPLCVEAGGTTYSLIVARPGPSTHACFVAYVLIMDGATLSIRARRELSYW